MGGQLPSCFMGMGGLCVALALLLLWYRLFGCHDPVVITGLRSTLEEARAVMSQLQAASAAWAPLRFSKRQQHHNPLPLHPFMHPSVAPMVPEGGHTELDLMNVALRGLLHDKHATIEAAKSKPSTRGGLQWGRLVGSDAEVAAWEKRTRMFGRPQHPVHGNVKVNHAITNQGMWKPATPEEYTRRPAAR